MYSGLKTYSNWPTYPQLYIDGELVGGLDIVTEMAESGELQELLPKRVADLQERLKGLINTAPVMLFMKVYICVHVCVCVCACVCMCV